MEALLIFSTILIAFVVLAALASAFGVDNREGFTNERQRSSFS